MSCWVLLAEVSELATIRRVVTAEGSPWPARIAFVAAGVAILGVVWLIISLTERFRFREKTALKTPEGLFHHLCRVHRLSRSERSLLVEFNSHLPAREWALVFIDPQILQAQCHGDIEVAPWVRMGSKIFGDSFTA